MKKGLTVSIIFDADSANYGENIGNIAELKKFTKYNESYTFISRQAIRYDVYRMLTDGGAIPKEAPLTKENKVIQFSPNANVKDYMEVDLFGYMRTVKSQGAETRSAVVRFSPAVSLEPYKSDTEFAANHNFVRRLQKTDKEATPDPFQKEIHSSLYTYTMTIDLDRVGKEDGDEQPNIEPKERTARVNKLLSVIEVLNREIKGRTENFNPLFIIGGIYPVKNPYFLGRIALNKKNNNKPTINTDIIKSASEAHQEDTMVGYIDGYFSNDFKQELESLRLYSVAKFFDELRGKVDNYYLGK